MSFDSSSSFAFRMLYFDTVVTGHNRWQMSLNISLYSIDIWVDLLITSVLKVPLASFYMFIAEIFMVYLGDGIYLYPPPYHKWNISDWICIQGFVSLWLWFLLKKLKNCTVSHVFSKWISILARHKSFFIAGWNIHNPRDLKPCTCLCITLK